MGSLGAQHNQPKMSRNYYEVLGVRINASQQEIELAYKGRRTQYHPDKYATTDEATITWATQKMQELNEAYTALSTPQSREEHDREVSGSGDKNHPKRATSPQPEEKPEEPIAFSDYLKANIGTPVGLDKVFVAPNIPWQKLQGAYSVHQRFLKDINDIVVLVDDTVFGGAKEGFVISNSRIMFKELGEGSFSHAFDNIGDITSKNNAIYHNGNKIIKLNLPEAAKRDRVKNFFN